MNGQFGRHEGRPCAQDIPSETCDFDRLTIGDRYRGLVRPGPVGLGHRSLAPSWVRRA